MLKEKKINSIDVIGIAKEKKRDVRFDKVYDKNGIVDFEKNDKCFFFSKNLEMKHIDLLFPLIRKEEEERSDLHHLITLTE